MLCTKVDPVQISYCPQALPLRPARIPLFIEMWDIQRQIVYATVGLAPFREQWLLESTAKQNDDNELPDKREAHRSITMDELNATTRINPQAGEFAKSGPAVHSL